MKRAMSKNFKFLIKIQYKRDKIIVFNEVFISLSFPSLNYGESTKIPEN